MNKQTDPTTTDTRISTHPNVQISATDFGPIAGGTVDLRPLTVFVGPSNTGKTYFAILIYALHRILNGFPKLPVMFRYNHHFGEVFRYSRLLGTDAELQKEELLDVLEKLETEGRSFRFSDLPRGVRDAIQANLNNPELLVSFLRTELERCFDLDSVSDLVRLSGGPDGMQLALNVNEETQPLWHFRMRISDSEVAADGKIEDMLLLPETRLASEFKPRREFIRLRELIREGQELESSRERRYLIEEFFIELLYFATPNRRSGTHYLPAARSGIMQSHRVIASSLVARSTRAGLERFPELPTFSGVMADFMQRLILYEEDKESDAPMRNLAHVLERDVLDGQIRTKRPPTGGYPEFVYQPRETEKDIRLTRASSMVSELAPIVLFLRGTIDCDDLLIIEEPEAHLHPAAQTQMAKTLGRLVRAGVRVVVTTHSDWLLKEIGNLMRAGELGEESGERANEESLRSSLQPSAVGVWLFRKGGPSAGSTVEEIPFDSVEGVEPAEYEDVAEELYNRSADLQNRLAETTGGTKHGHE